MNINEIHPAILGYFESKIMPNIPNTFTQWATFLVISASGPAINKEIEKYISTMTSTGIVSPDGQIDLDKLDSYAVKAFEKVPEIKIGNMGFALEDFKDFIGFCRSRSM